MSSEFTWLDPRENPCPYCGGPVRRADSANVYGKSFGWLYICSRYPECDAFVGCHQPNEWHGHDGTEPKGRLADPDLRELKKKAHRLFDPLWQSSEERQAIMTRREAYKRLALAMGLPSEVAHIGYMDTPQLESLIDILQRESL